MQSTAVKSTVTNILIIVNVLVYIFMAASTNEISGFDSPTLMEWGALTKASPWWTAVTSMFLHANLIHILFNMIALKSFGTFTEIIFGKSFLPIYLVSGLGASLGVLIFSGANVATVGASGAICGLMGATFVMYMWASRTTKVDMSPLLINMAIMGGLSLLPGISASAHFNGFAAGAICGIVYIAMKNGKAKV